MWNFSFFENLKNAADDGQLPFWCIYPILGF
jgi:hypothetical protein